MSPVSCNLPSLCYRLLYLSRCQNCVCPNETIVFIQIRYFYLSRLDKCIRPDDMIKFVPMTILFAGKAALPRHPTISSWGTSLTAATTPSRPSPCSRSSRPGGPIRSAWNLPHPYTSYINHPSSFCHPWSVMLHRISYSTVQFFNFSILQLYLFLLSSPSPRQVPEGRARWARCPLPSTSMRATSTRIPSSSRLKRITDGQLKADIILLVIRLTLELFLVYYLSDATIWYYNLVVCS